MATTDLFCNGHSQVLRFPAGLAHARSDLELVGEEHRIGPPVGSRSHRTPRSGRRQDPFQPDTVLIESWLQAVPPKRSPVQVEWLIAHNPERYSDWQIRALQLRLGGYRLEPLQRKEVEMGGVGESGSQELIHRNGMGSCFRGLSSAWLIQV